MQGKRFDSNALVNQFRGQGYEITTDSAGADITVINTCSVTAAADKEARYLIRRYRRETPDTRLIVTGCYAQTDSARLVAMPEVDLVVPNEVKDDLLAIIDRSHNSDGSKMPAHVKAVSENKQTHFKSALTLFDNPESSQTRAFLKIQDGCNGFCTYCLIPYARGASRSVQSHEVLREVKRLINGGTKEIVFTGIHIGDYGHDLNGTVPEDGSAQPFIQLLDEVFGIPGVNRVRISSLEPAELTLGLVQLLAKHQQFFCDHLHLPLQSGNNNILKKMRRTYDTAEYAEAVAMARAHFPNINIGADVIPGFPGETDEEFQDTVDFIEASGINYLHVFPYSKRPNTAAARMKDHLPPETIKDRAAVLRALSAKLSENYARKFFGLVTPVLWEKSTDESGRRVGTTRNYLTIVAGSGYEPLPGTETLVKLRGFAEKGRILGTEAQPN